MNARFLEGINSGLQLPFYEAGTDAYFVGGIYFVEGTSFL